ncbi:MAG: membrane protein insertase YidC, partial [Prevotella sp.]|nr:membrane protein insertase YidC [Prevotella sp.]
MDKNTIIGFILIAAVLIGYSWWQQPSAEQIAEMKRQDSLALVAKEKAQKEAKALQKAAQLAQKEKEKAALEDTTALFHNALNGAASTVVLKNSKVELTLNTKGGTVEKAVIKNFKDQEGHNDVTLFDKQDQQLKFMLTGKENNFITSDFYFTPSEVTDTTVTMTADAGNGRQLVLKYRLGNSYMLHMSMQAVGMAGLFPPTIKEMDIQWDEHCRQQERGFTFENRYASITYHYPEGGTDKLNDQKDVVDKKVDEPIDWVCFKTQFFSSMIIAKDNFAPNATMTSLLQEKGSKYLKQYSAKMKTAFDPTGQQPSQFEFYYGPNDFRVLQSVEKESTFGKNLQMERLVYLGWWIIRPINRWFTLYVFDWLTSFGF